MNHDWKIVHTLPFSGMSKYKWECEQCGHYFWSYQALLEVPPNHQDPEFERIDKMVDCNEEIVRRIHRS